jgi:EAL domain-containing protein (putative c-di-GMP-specific phosphodiesterase class I)
MTIAEALHRLPGIDVAGVFEVTDLGLRALAIVGAAGFPIATGDLLPAGLAEHLRERSAHGPWAERLARPSEPDPYHEQLYALGFQGRAFAPLQVEGELIGLVGVATTDPLHSRHLIDDLPAVGEFATVAETILAPEMQERRVVGTKRREIASVIGSSGFRPVYQPIVELATGRTVGFEALTRFDDGAGPDHVFAAAVACGMGLELETATLAAALRTAHGLPSDAWLSVNVSPALLAEGDALVRLLADRPRPLVLEVTEHEAIPSYRRLREVMSRLGPGIRLAVDDAGAGIANFNHLVELRPDIVKIDIGLVRGVDADPSRRAVVAGLVHFAAQAGCAVLAEGIETAGELETVIELGVTLGQGYMLARPAPVAAWREQQVITPTVRPANVVSIRRTA